VFVDADDQVAPGFLTAMYSALGEQDFVSCGLDPAYLNSAWSQHAWAVPDSTYGSDRFRLSLGFGGALGITRTVLETVGGWPEDYERGVDLVLSFRVQLSGVPLAYLPSPMLRIGHRSSIRGLFRQTRAFGYQQVRAYREFGSRALTRPTTRAVVGEWAAAMRKLLAARSSADLAQCAVRFGWSVGRLLGSLRYRTLFL
jgi:hypothetical protein